MLLYWSCYDSEMLLTLTVSEMKEINLFFNGESVGKYWTALWYNVLLRSWVRYVTVLQYLQAEPTFPLYTILTTSQSVHVSIALWSWQFNHLQHYVYLGVLKCLIPVIWRRAFWKTNITLRTEVLTSNHSQPYDPKLLYEYAPHR